MTNPTPPRAHRPKPQPLRRTPAQVAKAVQTELGAAQEDAKNAALSQAQADATRLAQVVNLFIAGHSLASIGAAIGATPEEVDRMITQDAARYVRNQPALRTFVRGYLSAKYTELLDAVWDEATDKMHKEKLEHQDRALRILKEMGRLHGAEAPTQTEVTVEAGSETIAAVVAKIAAAQGYDYDTAIFEAEVTEDGEAEFRPSPAGALAALERASAEVENDQPEDEPFNQAEDEGEDA